MKRIIPSGVFKSTRAAMKSPLAVRTLDLSGSQELVCKNIMCPKLEETCICRLAFFLSQNDFANLRSLVLRNNNISTFAFSILNGTNISHIDLRENNIKEIDKDQLKELATINRNLESALTLDLKGNPIENLSEIKEHSVKNRYTVLFS